jgi:hypothetical protein
VGREARIRVHSEQIEQFCKKHHIRKLSLFGSVLRDDFKRTSDIDVLVEFEQGERVGLFKIAGMERELSDLMGRKVDLRTPQDLSRYFRQEVLETAEVQYAEG